MLWILAKITNSILLFWSVVHEVMLQEAHGKVNAIQECNSSGLNFEGKGIVDKRKGNRKKKNQNNKTPAFIVFLWNMTFN